MAVQAPHLNPFPPSLSPDNNLHQNEEVTNTLDMNACSMFSGGQMRVGRTSTSAVLDSNVVMHNIYQTNGFDMMDASPLPPWTPPPKAESGITYVDNWCLPLAPRKRCRENVGDVRIGHAATRNSDGYGSSPKYAILGENLSFEIQSRQSDVDRIISQHMENVRVYIDQKSKFQMRKWAAAVEYQLAKRLRGKEEEVDRMGKLNWSLEERIKSLCMENQIWKDLARANEDTANALRNNLEEALSQTREVCREGRDAANDAESSCGSAVGVGVDEMESASGREPERWRCRGCGKEEARVLTLPCRHLCMCAACDSSTHVCPVCRSPKNASLLVNFA